MQRFHEMPFGALLQPNGVDFRLWAPSLASARLWTPEGEFEMEADGEWHRLFLEGAKAGQPYRFRVSDDLLVPDPASRFQADDIDGPSQVLDPRSYAWSDGDWKGRPWEEAVIYEAHVGTATPEGTFTALAEKLDQLAGLGITAVELMPVADFPGSRSWGYDGVLHYAPDHAYGSPDELKALIDRAHSLGIMMLLDVVYNHFGPSGNYLPTYAGSFFTERHQTPWGAGINFDGRASSTVRDFYVHNALYWLEEYHFDGLRFDAVHAIADDSRQHFIAEIAARIREKLPARQVHLVLENAANEARWLERKDRMPVMHTAQWADDIHHVWHRLVTGESDGYYSDYDDPVARLGRCLAEGFVYQGEFSEHEGAPRGEPSDHLPPSAFVAFLQNHDQVGNRAFGERLNHIAEPEKLALARAGLLLAPQIPLIFMGEEWAASAPFQYFVDFTDEELAKAVRDGRRREFGGFGAFKDEAAQERIPDPTLQATVDRSTLDWSEAEKPPHREVLAQIRDLLRIRHASIVPLTASGFEGARWSEPAPGVLDVQWRFAAGTLRFVANFGDGTVELPAEDGQRLWASEGVLVAETIALGPWTGAVLAHEGHSGQRHEDGATALAAPVPRGTYRLQFHQGFTFEDATAIVPYLARLGISHVYASPIQTARPGSTHGYDIVDHRTINPELGGEAGFIRLSDTLKAHGLGLLIDIVPNHMGIGGADNAWWLSVIEWGRLSPHAAAFDIDWERLGANGKLVLPFLGKRYGEALEDGELTLTFEPEEGGFSIWHFEQRFPISPLTYPIVLDRILMLAESTEPAFREVLAISARLRILSEAPAGAQQAGLVQDCEALKQRLTQAFESSAAIRKATERAVALINGAAGLSDSFDTLHRILEMQSYRLAYWRVAASDINYRRFFDINTLAGIRVEEPEVFERTHALILELVREGRIQGLRIDHIDGLADPEAYLRALQAQAGPGFYILAEKILGRGETLRAWPMSGTTGYDVLNVIDGVLVDRSSKRRIEADYRRVTGEQASYQAMLHRAKGEVLDGSFASELEVVVSDLARIAAADRRSRDYTAHAMRRALTEIITHFPVYRTYIVEQPAPEDRALVEETVATAIASSRLPDHTVHAFIARALLGEISGDGEAAEPLTRFRRRFQQLTGPVTAKSVEDTLFYRYGAMLALNEVGGEPDGFGFSLEEFHAANAERARSWPHGMIATATHDTKRGEDGRARLLVLSEMPDRWQEAAEGWQTISPDIAASDAMPDANDRHIILQQLLASWPLALLEQDDQRELDAFRERMQQWAEKALREAKRRTSWVNPKADYEAATKTLIANALKPGSPFLQRFRPLAGELARRGMLKSVARTVLKLTLPGVPDFYQGTEFWDFSLVDPDNRRPVDYGRAERALDQGASLDELLASWPDGRIKQRIVHILLEERAASPRLYADGDYRTVAVEGEGSAALLAFERVWREEAVLVIVRRSTQGGESAEATAVRARDGRWQDLLTGRAVMVEGGRAAVAGLLGILPVAVLRQSPGGAGA
ncbi:malto-oligosyltrehalose synthase/malto-oligosyltrehalose trehalohydrolase,TIGR02402 [Bosea sp. TND4EK4]|nr:malto-oligosyltrehalose synthase/malto-oligosyltrehalose trehalohydrolase,TIGR02402 [Bosea sp. TND4EK4]